MLGAVFLISSIGAASVAAGRALPAWTSSALVGDGTLDGYDSPDLELGSDGVLRCTFAGREYGASGIILFSKDILYASSSDGGRTWSSPSVVVRHISEDRHLLYPDFALASAAEVRIVYAAYNDSNGLNIRCARSVDGGESFSSDVQVDDGSPGGDLHRMHPNSLSDGMKVFVVWLEWGDDATIQFSRSVDGGASFLAADIRVDTDAYPAAGGTEHQPVIARAEDTGRLYVVWASTTDASIVLRWSDDDGSTWSDPVVVNDVADVDAKEADIVCGAGGLVDVVWSDQRNGQDTDIFMAYSADGGVSFGGSARVDAGTATYHQYEPHLFREESGKLHCAYLETAGFNTPIDLYYTRSDDGGVSWERPDLRVNASEGAVGVDVPVTFDLVGRAGETSIAYKDQSDSSDRVLLVTNSSLIFSDGFETGDASGWAYSQP